MFKLIPFMIAVFVLGCQQQPEQKKEAVSDLATATISVNTIKCKMCVTNINGAVMAVDGVQECDVDFKAKTATVKYVQTKVDLSAIEGAIAAAGYDANDTKRDDAAYQTLDKCCQ